MKPNVGIYFTSQPAVGPGPRIRYAFHLLVLLTVCIASEAYADPLRNFYLNVEAHEGGRTTGTGFYEEATVVTIQAHPDYGYTFDHWTGHAQGGDSSFPITLDRNKSATAHFEPIIVHLTLNATNGGRVLGSGNYHMGTDASIMAIPDAQYRFSGWTGDFTNSDAAVYLPMTQNLTLTAHFEEGPPTTDALITSVTGNGTITGGGNYVRGTRVTVTAIPKTGYFFERWFGIPGILHNSTITVTMMGDRHLHAMFEKMRFRLDTRAWPGGRATGSGTYDYGTVVTVRAIPNPDYRFTSWSDDLSGNSPVVDITMTDNQRVTAHFERIPPTTYTLTTSATPGGAVTGGGTFENGKYATVRATPNMGYRFTGWSGDTTGNANPIGILMDADKSATASFERILYTLTTSAGTGGTVTPGGSFPHNAVVLVQGDPLPSHRFLRWTGHASGTSPTVNVLMNSNKSVSGLFAAKLDQQILFDDPGDHNADDEPVDLNVRATSGLPVALTVIQGDVTLDGQAITLNGPTAVVIRAEQPGNDTYNPAVPVSIEFNVVTEGRIRITKSTAEIKLLRSRSAKGTSSFLLGD